MRRLLIALLVLGTLPVHAQIIPGSPFGGGSGTGTGVGPPLTLDGSGGGGGTTILRSTMSGASSTSNFGNITGTFPSSTSASNNGILFQLTSAGSSAFPQNGLSVNVAAGYTGASNTIAIATNNAGAGTGTSNPNIGVAAQSTGTGAVGIGAYMASVGTTTNSSLGGIGLVQSNSAPQAGLVGFSGGTNLAANGAGLLALISNSLPGDFNAVVTPYIIGRAALQASNEGTTYDIAKFFDNTTEVWAIGDNGDYRYYRTITAGGTTGAQTINKPAGTVNFAAAATTLVVTDNLVTATSIIFCTVRTNDTTALIKNVVPAAGSFTITLNAAATAETSVGFLVSN